MAVQHHRLGFTSSYEVEVDPEFPASGGWGLTEIRVGGSSPETIAIKVSPNKGEPWIRFFACDERGLPVGVYACPHPEHLLVVTGLDAYLVSVSQPHDFVELPIHPITATARPDGTDLIVVGSFTELAAIDKVGLLWVTDRLFHDDLELVTGPPGKVYVQGSVGFLPSDPELLTIDPATGKVVAGNWDPALVVGERDRGWLREGK
jgi:hypothetical protein